MDLTEIYLNSKEYIKLKVNTKLLKYDLFVYQRFHKDNDGELVYTFGDTRDKTRFATMRIVIAKIIYQDTNITDQEVIESAIQNAKVYALENIVSEQNNKYKFRSGPYLWYTDIMEMYNIVELIENYKTKVLDKLEDIEDGYGFTTAMNKWTEAINRGFVYGPEDAEAVWEGAMRRRERISSILPEPIYQYERHERLRPIPIVMDDPLHQVLVARPTLTPQQLDEMIQNLNQIRRTNNE